MDNTIYVLNTENQWFSKLVTTLEQKLILQFSVYLPSLCHQIGSTTHNFLKEMVVDSTTESFLKRRMQNIWWLEGQE